jgi:hypothetical protein
MSDKPILFSGPMIRAIREDRKSQTRRIIKPQPPANWDRHCWFSQPVYGWTEHAEPTTEWFKANTRFSPGDRLWVRETWRAMAMMDDLSPSAMPSDSFVTYDAADAMPPAPGKTRVSIHMPRWASRLTLAVTDVRVERLQDISEEDAVAEGCFVGKATRRVFDSMTSMRLGGPQWRTARDWYADLWETINGADSWAANPWVVALTFTTERRNIDASPQSPLLPDEAAITTSISKSKGAI